MKKDNNSNNKVKFETAVSDLRTNNINVVFVQMRFGSYSFERHFAVYNMNNLSEGDFIKIQIVNNVSHKCCGFCNYISFSSIKTISFNVMVSNLNYFKFWTTCM